MMNHTQGMWNYWIFAVIGLILLAMYVANDAARFGESGMLWGLVVLFMPMLGLLVYLVVRSNWSLHAQNNETQSGHRTVPPRVEQVRTTNTIKQPSSDQDSTKGENRNYFCTACGVKNNNNATYCNSCGAEILG